MSHSPPSLLLSLLLITSPLSLLLIPLRSIRAMERLYSVDSTLTPSAQHTPEPEVSRARSRSFNFVTNPHNARSGFQLYPPPVTQQTVVVDGALPPGGEPKEEKTRRRETIFGPDVGDDDQPGWTKPDAGTSVSVDVVKRWVERAKAEEGLHATTTLQALVNLKRPSLLLQPIEHDASDISSAAPLHILKFSYDAMTPQVRVTLSLYPTPTGSSEALAEPRVLYTGLQPGGFNQKFSLPTTAALDLSPALAPVEEEDDDDVKPKDRPASEDTTRSSIERAQSSQVQPEVNVIPELTGPAQQHRRFGLFGRRHRELDVEAAAAAGHSAGAGAIEMTPQQAPEEEKKDEPEHGMRLLIRLEAVGPSGARRNAQLTHMLVSGSGGEDENDKRVWVVKVVRREAQIGAHSFLLKEIYGLSSSGAETSSDDPYASTPNECIVCLTSPRDVVLLPCRHLVVCRECAVGMVEFGAGGRVARREEDDAAPIGTAAGATTAGGIGATADAGAPALAAPPPPPTRRKKKAKGWYCPVCRQPYTSLLRLALPSPKEPESPGPTAGAPLLSRQQSMKSIRSTRTTRSLAPTLPDGAEEMLSRLGPEIDSDEEEERPRFVLAEENPGLSGAGTAHATVPAPGAVASAQHSTAPATVPPGGAGAVATHDFAGPQSNAHAQQATGAGRGQIGAGVSGAIGGGEAAPVSGVAAAAADAAPIEPMANLTVEGKDLGEMKGREREAVV